MSEKLEISRRTTEAFETWGVLRHRDLWDLGNRGSDLELLKMWGAVVPIGAGLYRPRELAPRRTVLAARRIDRSALCLYSALHVHGLLEPEPEKAWIALPRGRRRPRPLVCPLEVLWCAPEALANAVEFVQVDGVQVPVTTLARTLVDCVRLRSKVDVALTRSLLQEALHSGRVDVETMLEEASRCRARSNVEAELVRIRPELATRFTQQRLEERRVRRRERPAPQAPAAPREPLPPIDEDRWLW